MTNWQQIAQGEPNPFDVVRTTTDGYQANYDEFVITDQDSVQLPAPQANAAVAIRGFEQNLTVSTPSGNIWDYGSSVTTDIPQSIIFVSDGTDWYIQSREDIIAIPDSLIDNFEDGDANNTTASNWGTWSVSSGTWTAVTSPSLADTYSGEYNSGTSGGNPSDLTVTRDSGGKFGISFLWQADYQSGNGKDEYQITVRDGTTGIAYLSMQMDGAVAAGVNNTADSGFTSWSTNTTYNVSISLDFFASEYTLDFGGSTTTQAFENSASSVNRFGIGIDNFNGSQSANMYIDDIQEI